MSELPHTLTIVQEKLKTLNKRRIEHVQKAGVLLLIATKRTLLQQSYSVLQHDLKMALDQDKKTIHSISSNHNNTNSVSQLVPIISPQTEQSPVNDTSKPKQFFELVECQGWIRAGQVIIRATGITLLDCQDISRVHLWLPNSSDFSPEDIRLTTRYNILPSAKHVFYMSFPLLLEDEEEDMKTHSISCVYKVKNEYYTSESIPIQYSNNARDTSWLLDSIRVLQVYFTCRVRVKQAFKLDNNKAVKKLHLHPVSKDDDSFMISKDQSILIHKLSDDIFDIYGFKANKVASIVSKYKHDFRIMSHHDDTLKNLILSFGDESVTFGTVDCPSARAKMHCFMATQ